MQILRKYETLVDRILRPGTCRRHYYELGLSGIRVILNEGWKNFFRKAKVHIRGKKTKASKQP